jgi:hypothetical protein
MSEFSTSKRIAATLAMSLGLVGCGNSDRGVDHYIENAAPPHSQNGSIPEGKVLPPGVTAEFRDGLVAYQAPPEIAASTGLLAVTAFCGNPLDKRDPYNLYTVMSVRQENGEVWEVTAGMTAAAACADGTITAADRPAL